WFDHTHTTSFCHFIPLTQHLIHFRFSQSDRIFFTKKMDNIRRILDDVPEVISQLAIGDLDHHISRIVVTLAHYFLSVSNLIYFLYGKENLLHLVASSARDLFIEILSHFLFF